MLLLILVSFIFFACFTSSHSQSSSLYVAKESFRELIEPRDLRLEEHHFWSDTEQRMITVHRVVPSQYNATEYSHQRRPLFLVEGILARSSLFYIGADFLQSNGSFCAHHFGLCLLFTDVYDLWILNDAEAEDADGLNGAHHLKSSGDWPPPPPPTAGPKYISLSAVDRPFWLSSTSLPALSAADHRQLSTLVSTVTGSGGRHHPRSRRSYLIAGYSSAADSLFALLSVTRSSEASLQPFLELSEAKRIGSAAPGVGLLGHIFTAMPGLYVPREGVQRFLRQISARASSASVLYGHYQQHYRRRVQQPSTSQNDAHKMCAVLLMSEDDAKSSSSATTVVSEDYSSSSSSSASSSTSVTSSSDSYAAVTFQLALLTGSSSTDWLTMLIAVQQLVEVLREHDAPVIDYGCLR